MTFLRMRRASDPLLVFVDVLSALVACLAAFAVRFGGLDGPGDKAVGYRAAALGVAIVWVLIARADGLYRRAALRPGVSNLEEATIAALACSLPLWFASIWVDLDVRWIVLTGGFLVVAGCGTRIALRRTRRFFQPFGLFLERYAILGDDAIGHRLFRDLTRGSGRAFQVVTLFSMGVSASELLHEARALNIDGIVVPEGRLDRDQHAQLATLLAGAGIDLLLAPGLGDLDLRVSTFAMLHGVPLLRTAGLAPRRRAVRVPPRLGKHGGVAIFGTRGVPARHGRFEVLAEHLATYFVDNGVPVTVYGRRGSTTPGTAWNGVRRVSVPAWGRGRCADITQSFFATAHLVFASRSRNVLVCGAANGPFLVPMRVAGKRPVVVLDGLDWRRGPSGPFGRGWERAGEWLTIRLAAGIVADSQDVRTYLRVRHDSDALVIPHGTDFVVRATTPPPAALGIEPDAYVFASATGEAQHPAVEAHAIAGVDMPLVLIGDVEGGERLRRAAAPNAVFAGRLHGDDYRGVLANARCYVHTGELASNSQGLIDALGAGNLCLVLDTPDNRAAAGDVVRYYNEYGELAELLRWADKLTHGDLRPWREAAAAFAAERYSWQDIAGRYRSLLTASI